MGRGVKSVWRRMGHAVAPGMCIGVALGLVYGHFGLGLVIGALLSIAFFISSSGLGPTSKDR